MNRRPRGRLWLVLPLLLLLARCAGAAGRPPPRPRPPRAPPGPMLARRWGRVINIASLVGLHGAPYVTAYAASKHALVGLTRALALEVAGRGGPANGDHPRYDPAPRPRG